MDRIIHCSTRLDCAPGLAFEMFTVGEFIQSWLAPLAEVEPVAGGRYELFWEPGRGENNSTIGCKVIAIEPCEFLSFEWKGPRQFKHLMNEADPLTHVVVFFVPCSDGVIARTGVHLMHSGWGETVQWREARRWFERAWQSAFEELKAQVSSRHIAAALCV
ncbi:MAG TPA: SRPBCC domain-containing protein [Pyrinomonadaceae bacterium]|jgi:uncharacterized protein YndB with AHSA1/START domain